MKKNKHHDFWQQTYNTLLSARNSSFFQWLVLYMYVIFATAQKVTNMQWNIFKSLFGGPLWFFHRFVLKLEKVRMKLLSVFVTYKVKTYSEQHDRLKIEIFIRIKEYSKVSCNHMIDNQCSGTAFQWINLSVHF